MNSRSVVLAGILLAAALATYAVVHPTQVILYVSPTGNDTTGDGSSGNPWATIGKARDYIRLGNLNRLQFQDIIVNLAAGVYPITSTIKFGVADGGFNNRNVIYHCQGSAGSCVIDGGTQLTSWTLVSGSQYKATLPGGGPYPYTVYENGIRSYAARWPHRAIDATYATSKQPYAGCLSTGTHSATICEYISSDISDAQVAALTVGDVQMVVWPAYQRWFQDTLKITATDSVGELLTVGQRAKFYMWYVSRGQYFLQGDKSLLANGGEWYVDRAGGLLYYIARDGAIGSQSIYVPTAGLTDAIQVTGASPRERVNGLIFDGITVRDTDMFAGGATVSGGGQYQRGCPYDFDTGLMVPCSDSATHSIDPGYSYVALQLQWHAAAVHLTWVDHVALTNMHIYDVGTNGILVEGYGQQVTISNTKVEKTGLAGINFSNSYPGEGDYVNSNTITNTSVSLFGELEASANGIELYNSGTNLVQYTTIHDGPHRGIWVVADSPLANNAWVYTAGNTIDHTLIYNMVQDSGDSGGITFSFFASGNPPYSTNYVTQTIVHDIGAPNSMINIAPDGVFFDDQSNGQNTTNVYVYNVRASGGWNAPGGGNLMRINDSGNITATNCSYNSDGTVNGSFNVSAIDVANIGTNGSFPYTP